MNQIDISEFDDISVFELSIADRPDASYSSSVFDYATHGRKLDLSKHEITTDLFIINTTRSKFDSGIFSTRYILPQCAVDIH